MKTTLLNALAWLTGASKTVLSFLLPILATGTASLLTNLLPIAIDVVRGLADSSKSGSEKRAAAFADIKAEAVAAGITASASAINLAIELAVAKLNDESPAK